MKMNKLIAIENLLTKCIDIIDSKNGFGYMKKREKHI